MSASTEPPAAIAAAHLPHSAASGPSVDAFKARAAALSAPPASAASISTDAPAVLVPTERAMLNFVPEGRIDRAWYWIASD